jgi:hypothetical protein
VCPLGHSDFINWIGNTNPSDGCKIRISRQFKIVEKVANNHPPKKAISKKMKAIWSFLVFTIDFLTFFKSVGNSEYPY